MSDVVQGTQAWLEMRLGKATGSNMSRLRAKTKTGWGASRASYASELVLERLTGKPTQIFQTQAMKDGTEREPLARNEYNFIKSVDVQEVAFIHHPRISMAGSSPDGLVGDDGCIEIKCKQPAGHLETLLTDKIDDGHIQQVQWLMACSGRKWCDYIGFNPDFPPEMQLFIKRIERDDKLIAEMESDVQSFLSEIDAKVELLKSKYGKAN